MAQYQKNKTKKSSKKWLVVGLVVLLVAVAAAGWLWLKPDSEPKEIKLNDGKTAIADPNVPGSEDKNEDEPDVTPGTIGGPSNSKDYGSNVPGQTTTDAQPTKPTGTFISNPGNDPNHPVKVSTSEESVCTTTPGVYCELRFTSGSTTYKSDRHKTNANGSAIWSWTPGEYSLTPGTWQVTMVAINGSKTASSTSAQPLVVKQ